MKELSIEQKAEAYDLALERAKKWYNAPNIDKIPTYGNRIIEEIFPELKESEDEIVIAALKSGINGLLKEEYHLKGIGGISFNRINAWLEKQSQTFTKEDTDNANKVEPKDYNGIDPHFGKPVDKVESKFKVGDWVVSPNGGYWHIDRIENNRYEVTSDTGKCACANWPLDTDLYHLWTIADTKKGDVIACDKCILIFDQLSEFNNEQALMDICHCTSKGFYWQDTKDRDMWALDGFKPATKEQRDALFAKMKEASFEWDAEKKELKRIEQKPTAWSGEDNTYYDDICEILINLIHSETAKINKDAVQKDLDWLMSIKQRIETK